MRKWKRGKKKKSFKRVFDLSMRHAADWAHSLGSLLNISFS